MNGVVIMKTDNFQAKVRCLCTLCAELPYKHLSLLQCYCVYASNLFFFIMPHAGL